MSNNRVSAVAERLTAIEIPEQVNYHREIVEQFGKFERRLAIAAKIALGAAIMVAVTLGIAAYLEGGVNSVWWKPIANILIGALPAANAAFNGIRADADLVRLVARSAATATELNRLDEAIRAAPVSYDRLRHAALRLAAIMASELIEWRVILESRRGGGRWLSKRRPYRN